MYPKVTGIQQLLVLRLPLGVSSAVCTPTTRGPTESTNCPDTHMGCNRQCTNACCLSHLAFRRTHARAHTHTHTHEFCTFIMHTYTHSIVYFAIYVYVYVVMLWNSVVMMMTAYICSCPPPCMHAALRRAPVPVQQLIHKLQCVWMRYAHTYT